MDFVKDRGAQAKRDKLTVRAGFTTKVLDDDSSLLVPEVLEGQGYKMSTMRKPDISKALEMPGGVSN